MFSSEFCEILKITFFIEHLRSVAFTGISCTCLLILFFTDFKLMLKVGTKPITVYLIIPLSKNSYHVETRTVFYMIQVFTERYFRTGSRTQWIFRCSKLTVFKVNNKNTSTMSLLLTFNISNILSYCLNY